MNKVKPKTSIRRSLMSYFLLLSLVPLITVSLFTYNLSKETLKKQAKEKLNYSSELAVKSLESWFDDRLKDISKQANSSDNLNLLNALVVGLNDTQLPLAEYVGSQNWENRIQGRDQKLRNLLIYHDFIYDVFLVDVDGNVLYTIAREDDLGTNLITGSYSSTRFGKSVSRTLDKEVAQFSDLEYYQPSNNILAGFLSAPIKDGMGILQGVLAIQFRFDPLKEIFENLQIQHLKHYIIGQDGMMRTTLIGDGSDVLTKRVTEQQVSIKHRSFTKSDVKKYLGPSGVEVFGLNQRMNILGIQWHLISEIDEDIALNLANWLGQFTLLAVLLMSVLASVLALLFSNRITSPIQELADATAVLASGEYGKTVEVVQENEIGLLAKSFNKMVDALERHEHELGQALLELNQQKFALDQHSIVAITDLKGTITFVNERFEEISGYSREELIGQNHRILNSGLHNHDFWRNMFRTISQGNVWKGEIRNKNKQGEYYWVDTTVVPFNENGRPKSYVAIRSDITQRKLHEMELVEARNKAEAGAKAKSEFLATMSHEIRTPMNGVLGMLGILLRADLPKEQKHQAQIAKQSAESLLLIINDILDYSKVEAGKLQLEYLEFDLRAMLGEFIETVAHKAQEKNLEIILDVSEIDLSTVKGDPGRIRQVLSNLVSNAIKFTNQGEIVIRASLKKQSGKSLMFHCAVEDTGIGIESDKSEALFAPFTQADASTSRRYGGTGLGLAIVKQLCELMGGGIQVSSEEGKGSCFEFTVKLKTSAKAKQVVPVQDMTGVEMLIVDDNATNRHVLRKQLERWGVVVTSAESGQRAINILEQRGQDGLPCFQIALLDMQMPDMDGSILGKKLHRDARFADMKLVMMTSMAMRGDARFFADLGFSAYFPKPANMTDLYHALSVVLTGGEILQNASPLVTHHYLNEIKFEEAEGETVRSREDETTGPEQSHDPDPKIAANTRVLVVEDNPVNQLIVKTLVEQINLNCDVAGNGMEAISALKKAPKDLPYSLVLMDCQMPEMDGYEATRQIREGQAGDYYRDVTIIALTANAMKGDKEKCLNSGMDDYLSKPIDNTALESMLTKWLLYGKGIEKTKPALERSESESVWAREVLLEKMLGNEQVVDMLIVAFIVDTRTQLNTMLEALEEADHEIVKITAHSIKGAANNVCAHRLSECASQLEELINSSQREDLEAVVEKLAQSFQTVEQAMNQAR